jgi:N-acetylmuramoyl-L-alanine amidase
MRIEPAMKAMLTMLRVPTFAAWLLVLGAFAGPGAHPASAQSAATMYNRALARERTLRDANTRTSLAALRKAVASYEAIVRRFPGSGYSDNALWQGANLALLAFERFNESADQRTGLRLLAHLQKEYPSSPLRSRIAGVTEQFEAAAPAQDAPVVRPAVVAAAIVSSSPRGLATVRDIRRTVLPDGVRVAIEMDGESLFRQQSLENPRRLFFDLPKSRASGVLQDATINFGDGVVKRIRLGQRPEQTTRVVLDMEGVADYTVFTLYNPFRVIVDVKSAATGSGTAGAAVATIGTSAPSTPANVPVTRERLDDKPPVVPDVVPLPARPATEPIPLIPTAPSLNLNGQFSLARQLGLGISRVVIDAGHGGHDPGARANGLNEAELVLDVASRLRTLLQKQPGMEVTMTRETDAFIPLEQRTAIANREGADLFLSIHANASRNARARGVETYFLNFASNPEAEAVAARENSTSGRTMNHLPEILRAIALNNKIDESRDFAATVQKSMVRKLGAGTGQVRDLGVKQAPFVVLIGAGMPSVLAEISFVTNKQDAQLLRTSAYRQQIAEALFDAILRYQGSLKKMRSVAARE